MVKRKRKEPERSTTTEVDQSTSGGVAEPHPLTSPSASTTTSIVPTKVHDGGKKPRRPSTAHSKKTPSFKRASSSTSLVTSDVPWPPHFTRLSHTHRALNIVFTFCCTRKHFATTFDNIKSAVETHIKRELILEDVAQIKALIPRAINFDYVDEAMLQVHVLGAQDGIKNGRAEEFRVVDPPTEQPEGGHRSGRDVLLFEFIDGDLKRQVQHAKTGEPTKIFRRLRDEDLKMPVFSQKQMTTLISKRNAKMTSAINAFLNQCTEDHVDPVEEILRQMEPCIPVVPSSRGTTPVPTGRAASSLPPTIPTERKSIPEILAEIKSIDWYTGQIVPDGHRVFDPQPPIYGDLSFQLSQNLVNALYNTRNITQLYSHQAEAINHLYEGHHVIVATSTSSGKSLIYQIPVLHALERDKDTRAMYIFPTKALAQDQKRSLKELIRLMPGLESTIVETFDGDTPMADRTLIRDEARIIFTNPDMLHITILPQE
ncbi:MAG: hypothetical protein M1838_004071, partial [Thelocarpon superellum]